MKKKEAEKTKDTEKDVEKPEDIQEGSNKKTVEELQNTIEKLQKHKDEIFAQLQRVSADYINYQKRVPKQISDTLHYEKEKIIKSLLVVLDNFERTIQNADKSENVEALTKGIRMVYDQMLDILKSHGVEQMETSGKNFDPSMHEAIMRKTDSGKEDNIVLEEFQKGYILNGKVLRPGKVAVNKLPFEQPKEQEQIEEEETDEEPETTDTEQS
jgi:molecular chaperone GrpE